MTLEICRICNTKFSNGLILREMMFGMRDEFPYGECPNCGSIQILEVPQNIEKYYPPYYVSFSQQVAPLKRKSFFKRMVRNTRMKRKYGKSNDHQLAYLKPIALMPDARILDIGSGKGNLICDLFNLGFEKITGVDKFISEEIDHGFGVKVLKKELSELKSDTYDLLIMHHVLEHVDDQILELTECKRLLKKDGVLLITIPILGEAWEIYKENWVQFDAPRHFVLHTLKSMSLLAEKTGFTIQETIFNSTAFQFLGSELYIKDIPLTLPDTHEWYPFRETFTQDEIAKFEAEAQLLNDRKRGDAASFYLYKK